MATKEKKEPARRPGRPKTYETKIIIPHDGIVPEPSEKNFRLEIVYEKPSSIKSIFTYFKNIKAKQIHVQCTPGTLTFFVRDHCNTQRTLVRINGDQLNKYYCSTEFMLYINLEYIEPIINAIDASIGTISFIQDEDYSSIYIILYNINLKKECKYKLELSTFEKDQILYDAAQYLLPEVLESYPIAYTISAKDFKKSISDILNLTQNVEETVYFEKSSATEPLHFYKQAEKISYWESYHDEKEIRLVNKLGNEPFRISVRLTNLKCLHNALLGGNITIYAKEGTDMIFTTSAEEFIPIEGGTPLCQKKPIIISTILQLK